MELLFGCTHPDYTWPQGERGHETVSCLSCGQGFLYSMEEMRPIGKVQRTITYAPDSYTGTMLDELTEQVERVAKV